jgi:hypothetical protein
MAEPTISDKISILDTVLDGVADEFRSDSREAIVPLILFAKLLTADLMRVDKDMFTDDEGEMLERAHKFLITITERLEQTNG